LRTRETSTARTTTRTSHQSGGVLLAANRPGHEHGVKSAYGVATRSAAPTLDPATAPWETGTYDKDRQV